MSNSPSCVRGAFAGVANCTGGILEDDATTQEEASESGLPSMDTTDSKCYYSTLFHAFCNDTTYDTGKRMCPCGAAGWTMPAPCTGTATSCTGPAACPGAPEPFDFAALLKKLLTRCLPTLAACISMCI